MRSLVTSPCVVSCARRLAASALVAITWGLMTASVWAKGSSGLEEEAEPKAYAACYIIMIMGISLGLILICRMGKRTIDFRRPD